jgi:hypothetical protein
VVIVFYLTYLGGSILARREDAFRSIRYHWRYISGPLLTALVCAVFAELLRNEILGQQLVQFAQDPNWYFGTLEMRLSKDLWVSAFERFEGASPRFLGYAYVALLFLTMQVPCLMALIPVYGARRELVNELHQNSSCVEKLSPPWPANCTTLRRGL